MLQFSFQENLIDWNFFFNKLFASRTNELVDLRRAAATLTHARRGCRMSHAPTPESIDCQILEMAF
jgi:hypothetical protein